MTAPEKRAAEVQITPYQSNVRGENDSWTLLPLQRSEIDLVIPDIVIGLIKRRSEYQEQRV
jgi:hypothetical protein